MDNLLNLHSFESLGALDGPGLRAVIFLKGCPLRCHYCHNPDTWSTDGGEFHNNKELLERIKKLSPYIKEKGGVTISGGEPLLQAEALIPFVKTLKQEGFHVALDTAGSLWNRPIEQLIQLVDLVLLDFKHTNDRDYKELTSGHLKDTQHFMEKLIQYKIPYWIRQVVIPSINDTSTQVQLLEQLTRSPYRERIELLPYHNKGLYKWHSLGRMCPLENTPPLKSTTLARLKAIIKL